MAKGDYKAGTPLVFNVVGGVDESVQVTETDFGVSSLRGVAPFYTGTWQRMFGKKIVDVNPNQSVMALAQIFNGAGQFGYFVQTTFKLYYHLCETPADLFIDFTLPTNLGVDAGNKTLNIFGQSENLELPKDTGISCVFEFPDKPPPPSTAYTFLTSSSNYAYTP